jgi:hypothetical protein
MRHIEAKPARAALERARRAAHQARIPALSAEVESAVATLNAPAARLIANGDDRLLRLDEVESLMESKTLVIDACRHLVRSGRAVVPLATRPVLFALVRALGEAWPGEATRDVLLSRAFGARDADESHRARLRVEVGRLRRLLRQIADVTATKHGFTLAPCRAREVVVLAHPIEVEASHAAVLALLADGESWSTSSIALALDSSQRTVQRALEALAADGKVHHIGRGRARRWIAPPLPGFATTLLLPAPFALD